MKTTGHDPYAAFSYPRQEQKTEIPARYRGAAWTVPNGTEGSAYIVAKP